jgi:hypothetical protein
MGTQPIAVQVGETLRTGELVGERVLSHVVEGFCLTVNVFPAMVMVPVRVAPVVLVFTEYVTVPSPVPILPAVIVIHESPLEAVQEQPLEAVTCITWPVLLAAVSASL